MDRRLWLKVAAGLSFSMAACQAVISIWPAAAEYFQAPPKLQNDRVRLFVVGEAAALIPVLFGLYALSGAGVIRRLPLLRTALVGIGSLFLLRGLFIILNLLGRAGGPARTSLAAGRGVPPGLPLNRYRVPGRSRPQLEDTEESLAPLWTVFLCFPLLQVVDPSSSREVRPTNKTHRGRLKES